MVKESSLNVECKLFQQITFGDHVMLIGEVEMPLLTPKNHH